MGTSQSEGHPRAIRIPSLRSQRLVQEGKGTESQIMNRWKTMRNGQEVYNSHFGLSTESEINKIKTGLI